MLAETANRWDVWGWLFGVPDVDTVDNVQWAFAAPWAQAGLFWLVLVAVVLAAAALIFYIRYQQRLSLTRRIALGTIRAALLVMLWLTLANPQIQVTKTGTPPPLLYLVLDGTDSMNIVDDLADSEQAELAEAVDLEAGLAQIRAVSEGDATPAADDRPTRMEYVKALLARDRDNPLTKLVEDKGYRLEVFLMDGDPAAGVRRLQVGSAGEFDVDPERLASSPALTASGRVTAIGSALEQLAEQVGASRLGGVVMLSDFAVNSGPAPVGGDDSPAGRLATPVYTVGVGPARAVELRAVLEPLPWMKKEKRAVIAVKVQQAGLTGQTVRVNLYAKRMTEEGAAAGGDTGPGELVHKTDILLEQNEQPLTIDYTPPEAGQYEITAEVEEVTGDAFTEDNRAARKVTVIDDYLRLLFVEDQPSWEWRFVKEVFHRDPDVGMEGFRTFLASADISVRNTNPLFLPTPAMDRKSFFQHDVIILGDVPRSMLTDSFCERVREFVSRFGGGLIVLAGPLHGPNQLVGTPLEDMLPVTLDENATIRDRQPFELTLTDQGRATPFMQLGAEGDDRENEKAWRTLNRVPWYFPAVATATSQTEVLAVHPTDTLADGTRLQPLIATRRFGSGEVVYVAFNETWRMRRMYGEKYYRTFWSQLIHKLGLAHALGPEKRFVPRTDREEYRPGEQITFGIEALDENFEELTAEAAGGGRIEVELLYPERPDQPQQTRTLDASLIKNGLFEARFTAERPGRYRLRVRDPITGDAKDTSFEVTEVSPERSDITRNAMLQQQLAESTGGRAYELSQFDALVADLDLPRRQETATRRYPLWAAPLWFVVAVGLMFTEWLTRKLLNLA